jgi:hypothetical protein
MCCGRSRAGHRIAVANRAFAPPVAAPPHSRAQATFEYVGRTALTVFGPVSRVPYRFAAPGARLQVDPRDRQGLAACRCCGWWADTPGS